MEDDSKRTLACAECGTAIPPRAPGGMCPSCLLRRGLSDAADAARRAGEPPRLPSVETMRQAFPQFEILGLLGRGGMGAVFKARQPKLDRLVAIKILPTDAGADPARSQRFLREARALARLSHPNIVTVHDFGETEGFRYFVMEFVEGNDLSRLMAARAVRPEQAVDLAIAVCQALRYAHEQGIVHRDIKPANILIDGAGRVKIADFGLAKILNPDLPDMTLTLSNETMGTPFYMAPEQRDPAHPADPRADIYSLGVLLYEMLTGQLPVGNFDPPSAKAPCHPRLDEVVFRAMKADPAMRYASAADMQAALERIRRSGVMAAPSRRGRLATAALLAGTVAVVTGLGLLWFHFRQRPAPLPPDVLRYGDHCYKVYFENVNWHEARRKCERMGGHLAIVNSKGEDDFLAAISRSHVWLGAADAEKEGQWVWIDGTPMTYSNWDYGEPNNARDPRTGKRENYLMISKYGRWNDLTEDSPVINGFVCEWDIAGPPAPRPASSAEDLHAALKQWNPQYNGKGILELRDRTIRGAILVHTGVTNLTPLRGLSLSSLDISWSDITDLSPLENVPLARLQASWSKVSDVSSLAGMPLTELRIDGTAVKDLTPLKGMPLTYLDISHSRITDLSPLAGMPLEELHMNCVKVTDLSPLAGMPLQRLGMLDTPARDATPLEKCASLESVALPLTIRNLDSLRRLPGLKFVNGDRAEPFWREHPGISTNAQPSSATEVR